MANGSCQPDGGTHLAGGIHYTWTAQPNVRATEIASGHKEVADVF